VLPPGPISNECLFERVPQQTPGGDASQAKLITLIKRGLIVNENYRGVNRDVWTILHRMYGGGPMLVREDPMNIYSKDLQGEYQACLNPKGRQGAVNLKAYKVAQTNIF